jgi:hypothetical protein
MRFSFIDVYPNHTKNALQPDQQIGERWDWSEGEFRTWSGDQVGFRHLVVEEAQTEAGFQVLL